MQNILYSIFLPTRRCLQRRKRWSVTASGIKRWTKRLSMGSDGSHQWMTVQNSFLVVNITKNRRITIAFTRKLATKSTYLPVMYKCILIITEKTMQFRGKDFKGKNLLVFIMSIVYFEMYQAFWFLIWSDSFADFEAKKTVILLIAHFKGKKPHTFIAVDQVVSLLSKTKPTWRNTRIFTWKMSSWTKMDLKSSWKTIHADLQVAGINLSSGYNIW